ncbi:MAG: hypothetical protein CL424_10320 [Acidimicrobiaceae bacterium]|nr:hypothetical protein [Acidimicrobiaceae bacterium]
MARLQALRINSRELLREPGLQKHVDFTVSASDLGVDDERIVGDVSIDLTATSGVDSVVVHGTVRMPWKAQCRRCLTDLDGTASIEVDEVYQTAAEMGPDDDAFPIESDQIDLVPAVREHLLLELPDDVLCREACAGICPVCGVDLNTGSCDCDTSVRDERWAALDDLRLDD